MDIREDLQLMDIIKTHSLNESQIRQLAELLLVKDKLENLNFARVSASRRLIQLEEDNYLGASTRRFGISDMAFVNGVDNDRKRLILQRYKQLIDASDPKPVL